ncbi:hypothetical protein DPMN_156049 [Dreissena polymorpha]|uniref:Uncharacterized protein n=1 Tax=Dreissena polymorpha TaxID=45954 RepID=A0A9D4FP16_DREPO|nr:hypothetical protein DPMN_156049 [Dreissena polymorpha]
MAFVIVSRTRLVERASPLIPSRETLKDKLATICSPKIFWEHKNILTVFHEDWKINVTFRVKNAPQPANLVTNFHENQSINEASRVLTTFYYSHKWKHSPPPCGHLFQATRPIFVLIQDITGTNLLTKFHENWIINVTSRVITRLFYRKIAPPHISHVFQQTS